MKQWLKRFWSRIRGDYVIGDNKPTPHRDQLIYGCTRSSLRDRFNKVRASSGYVPTRTDAELIDRIEHPVSSSSCLCGVSPEEVDAFMEKTINNLKKVPYVDVSGSCEGYNLRFSLQNMNEGWIPIRDNEGSGSV